MAYQDNNASIVRQSSLKWLMDYCKLMNIQLTVKEIFKITNVICDYCHNGYDADKMDGVIDAIDKHIAKKKKVANGKVESDFQE